MKRMSTSEPAAETAGFVFVPDSGFRRNSVFRYTNATIGALSSGQS
jgi:hypothetical protein